MLAEAGIAHAGLKCGLMSTGIFKCKAFTIRQKDAAFKIGTDSMILGAWAGLEDAGSILDIGTGTGILALMAAQRNGLARITAVEVDAPSCTEARYNFRNAPWTDRLSVCHQDIFALWDEEFAHQFDYVITNPPYHTERVLPQCERKKISRHGDTYSAMDVPRIAARVLSGEQAKFGMIIPSWREDALICTARAYGFTATRRLRIRSFMRKPPIRVALEFCRTGSPSIDTELVLYRQDQKPAEKYRRLMSPFLLDRKKKSETRLQSFPMSISV